MWCVTLDLCICRAEPFSSACPAVVCLKAPVLLHILAGVEEAAGTGSLETVVAAGEP